ncbi:MAG: hypothetical protein K5875_00535 [Saccharofermentans sp.]|nr:hypothetical protein [Saccharofermentans sp.]
MILSALKSILDIDNVGKRWGVRILYLMTVILNAAIHFNPWADTDFSLLQSWIYSYNSMTEYDPEVYEALMTSFPLSAGNIIYILTLMLSIIILMGSAYLYAAVFVREYRKEKIATFKDGDEEVINYAVSHIPDKPIEGRKLVGRYLLIMLFTLVAGVPIVLISAEFLFLAFLGLPFIFTAPVAYLSGDAGFFKSLPYSARLSKPYYFVNMRSIALVGIIAVILYFALPYLANLSLTAYYIIDAATKTWLWLSIARLAALTYCTMKDMPIKGSRRPFAI